MAEFIELDDVDGLGAGAVGEPGQRAVLHPGAHRADPAHRAGREGAGRAARRGGGGLPRPHRRRVPRAAVRHPVDAERAARAHRPAVPGPAHRPRVRPRARARPPRAARAPAEDEDEDEVVEVAEDDDGEGYVARIYATRAQVRAMAARGIEAVAGGRPPCPLCEHADGPLRAPLSSLELTPEELRAALEGAELEVVGRMRYSSNATFLVEAKVDGVELAAIYKPRRGERPLWDFPTGHALPAGGRGLRAVRRARVGHRAAHDPARRPARRRRGAAVRRPRSRRALLHAARRARGPLPRSSPGTTCSSTTPIARVGTASTTR